MKLKFETAVVALVALTGSAHAASVFTTANPDRLNGGQDTLSASLWGTSPGEFTATREYVPAESTNALVAFDLGVGLAEAPASATLELPRGCSYEPYYTYDYETGGYTYNDEQLEVQLSSVESDLESAFEGNDVVALRADLAEGKDFGRATFPSDDPYAPIVRIPLSQEALDALAGATGRFALGISLTDGNAPGAYAFACNFGVAATLRVCSAADENDGDGISCAVDSCPSVANEDQLDSDYDGLGDACDVCPFDFDSEQTDSNGDGQGDACQDSDNDGYVDLYDNCPLRPNADQLDSDWDGEGDACDLSPTHDLTVVRMSASRTTISLANGSGVLTVNYTVKNLRNWPESFIANVGALSLPANCGVTSPATPVTGVVAARGTTPVALTVGITCGLNAPRGAHTVTVQSDLQLNPRAPETNDTNNSAVVNASLRLNR